VAGHFGYGRRVFFAGSGFRQYDPSGRGGTSQQQQAAGLQATQFIARPGFSHEYNFGRGFNVLDHGCL
jgi:hypothetical protein